MRPIAAVLCLLLIASWSLADELSKEILIGVWQPETPAFSGNGYLRITRSTIAWRGCLPVRYTVVPNSEASKFKNEQPAGGDDPHTWKVITIQAKITAKELCFKHDQYIQFAFLADPSNSSKLEYGAQLEFYGSPKERLDGYYSSSQFSKRRGKVK